MNKALFVEKLSELLAETPEEVNSNVHFKDLLNLIQELKNWYDILSFDKPTSFNEYLKRIPSLLDDYEKYYSSRI